MPMSTDPTRLALVLALLASYAALCGLVWRRNAIRRLAPTGAVAITTAAESTWLVAFASQTGHAEDLATQAARSIAEAGLPVRLCSLGELDAQSLQAARNALFVVSTCGEGDAPDEAARFLTQVMASTLALPQLRYGLLALGDSSFTHYCGFGRRLDDWLSQQGGSALFSRVEVDRGSQQALQAWHRQVTQLGGATTPTAWAGTAFVDWRLVERRLINPGSAGALLYLLALEPVAGPLPDWQSGDLVQVLAPADPTRPRDYSIASIPADGQIHLLVRLHTGQDGQLGAASGWLAQHADLGGLVAMRVRAHRRFRLEGNSERPLILIGSGSGMAGLRSHLKARAQSRQQQNWLIFGERNAEFDSLCREDIASWRASGALPKLDLVFSRDPPGRQYVQDRLREHATELRHWVAQGAAVYVCGSLHGMAAAVDEALEAILGRAEVETLRRTARYRRDVY